MDSSLAILRIFGVLVAFLSLVTALFAHQIGAAAAKGAASAAAIAVTDLIEPQWDCTSSGLPPTASAVAASTVVHRTAQLAAVQPTAVKVTADGSCSVLVAVRVSSSGWLRARSALAVACRRPAASAGAAFRAPVTPPC